MNSKILFVVLLYELLMVIGVGAWLSSRVKSNLAQEGEFVLASRSLPMSVTAVTLAITVLGTAHILGMFEMSWYMGATAIWFSIAHVILLVLVCLGTGCWVRRLGITTVPEMLEIFYGVETRLMVSCVMAGVLFGILTIEAQGLGIIFSVMTGWSIQEGVIVGAILGILYVILAGMREIGWLNLINATLMYISLILATIFMAMKLPGQDFSSVAEYYHQSGDDYMLSIYGTSQLMLTFALGTIIAVVFSQGINQMLLQVAMSAKDESTVKKALWIAAPVNGLFGVFAVTIGLTAKAIPEFNVMGPKLAATSLLVNYLPNWLSAMVLATFLGAILSTFAMVALSPATIFSVDIYKKLFNPLATENDVRRVTQIVILLLSSIAMLVAVFLPPILPAMNWLFAWLVPVFWVVVFGFLWKRNSTAAVITLSVAWVVNSLWSFSSLPDLLGLEQVNNAYVTFVVTILVGILSNIMSKGEAGYLHSGEYIRMYGNKYNERVFHVH